MPAKKAESQAARRGKDRVIIIKKKVVSGTAATTAAHGRWPTPTSSPR
ncbi:MAG: hypothetical protein QM736_03720 [Vicinamibacterales bacterium]